VQVKVCIPWTTANGFGAPIRRPGQVREGKLLRESVLQHFQHIQDPRVDRTKHHGLMEIMTIALFAVLSGADGFVAIETHGKAIAAVVGDFLQLFYGYRRTIPLHGCLQH